MNNSSTLNTAATPEWRAHVAYALGECAGEKKLTSKRKLRIAQVAPLYESVPPRHYGGTERVVSWLTEELAAMGHEVTLYASGDSRTSTRLRKCCARALRTAEDCVDPLTHHMVMIEQVMRQKREFDIVHFHIDYLHYGVSRRNNLCHVTTTHGRLDIPDLLPLYAEFAGMPVVSISREQRRPLPWLNWAGNVYHGLPESLLRFHPESGKYLAFIGRISPEKRPDRAIEIAKRTGIPLKIAAKVDRADREYFETRIKHLLDDPLVEYIGEIGDREKSDFLGNAMACLVPIDWPEPFGITMIEAMACGTPVIAYRNGSVPELVRNGVSGWIVENMDEAVRAVERVHEISRNACRREFETRFTVERMAREYLRIYEEQIRMSRAAPREVQSETKDTEMAL